MKQPYRQFKLSMGIMALILATLFAVVSVSAAPDCTVSSDITGVLSSDGTTVTGTADNCTAVDQEIKLAIYEVYYDAATGTIYDMLVTHASAIVPAGETGTITAAIPTCITKVVFYTGSNPLDPGTHLDRQVYNAGKDNFCSEQPPPPPPTNPGTGTPGYWKNHPEAWPVTEITLGGMTYSREEAIALMDEPGRGDKTYTLFEHLVAATLNVLIGNDDSCVADTIADADAWLATNPLGSGVRANSTAWDEGEPLATTMDEYNNGLLCVPHRD